jgi:hypothetical protein
MAIYACWAWIETVYGTEEYEWVQGFDVGTQVVQGKGHMTVFRPLDQADEEGYSCGYYCEDWQLHYGVDKPTHKGVEFEFINQVLKVL